ncbi:hypothetical protein [Parasitella parasitica]|uniref:Uncharacterized protein n=1 Tax=Parasitella parasitica TaxID=35722 RepID=A0A0B7NCM2_9FUNG|nr:hypothetical protein [Parasitella parasitica]
MSSQQTNSIDDELFQFYIQYHLRLIKKSMLIWGDNSEKNIIVNILNNCQYVEGDMLRSVMSEIFDNSTLNFTHRKDDILKITGEIAVFSEKNTNAEQSSESIVEGTEPIHSDSSYEQPKVKRTRTLAANTRTSTPRKLEDSLGKQGVSKLLQKVLSKSAPKEIDCMVKYKERSRYVFHTRMKTLCDNIKINYTFPGEDVSADTPNCTFDIRYPFSIKTVLGQCQLNLTSYQLGKLREKEEQHLPTKMVRDNYAKYHSSLKKCLDNPTLTFGGYARYCKIIINVVERLGVYPLFFPEVLPPSAFKKMAYDDFSMVLEYLDERFSDFKDIARFDDNGHLILAEKAGSSDYSDESDAYRSRFLRNKCNYRKQRKRI